MWNNQGNNGPKQACLDVQRSFVVCTTVICIQIETDTNVNILPFNKTGQMLSLKSGSQY